MDINSMDLVERLQLEKQANLHGGIYHLTQVEMAYNSNRIEGSRISEKQTALIFENNILPPAENGEATKIDDIKETENHFKGLDYIIDKVDEPLTVDFIKNLHRILKKGTSDESNPLTPVGEFKILQNAIGFGYDEVETADPEEVSQKMNELIEQYEKNKVVTLYEIADFHVKYERIHPFADGNGRTGRLIMFKECLKHNVMPFVIKDVHREFYYRGLSNWGKENGYLLDTFGLSQDMYEQFLNKMKFQGTIHKKVGLKNKFEERIADAKEKAVDRADPEHKNQNKSL
ncbi:Fic family protein [Enterococcus faecalis 13-SD-W-01]|nr:Fic family protein [Enterococcus faecalis 13-SD-W-01]